MNPNGFVTMHEVARVAGVSRATVSLALRRHPGIPESTRAKVQQAAEALGYRPDPLVATLMARLHGKRTASETPTLAVLDYSTDHPRSLDAFDQFRAGAEARAAALGFRLESFSCNAPEMTPERLEKILRSRSIFGMLLPPLVSRNQPVTLDWSRYALAGFASCEGDFAVDRVGADHFGNAALAIERLTRLGYRRIGFAMPAEISAWVQHKWLAAYLLFQRSLPASRRLPPYLPAASDFAGFERWIAARRPDVLIYLGELHAYTQRLALRVPGDLALASLNTFAASGMSGIFENSDAIGAAAVDLVVSRIHRNERGLPAHPQTVLIRGDWHAGRSTAPVENFMP